MIDTNNIDFPEFVTKREAAELLHCSTRTITRYIAAGKLKYSKPSPRKLLIDLNSLRALVTCSVE